MPHALLWQAPMTQSKSIPELTERIYGSCAMANIQIRKYRDEDAEIVKELFTLGMSEHLQVLPGIRQMVIYMFNKYIETSLSKDLNNISETYLQQKDSCYWVAESDGRVVGTVACLPAESAPEFMELKRMSVRRSHRGMGIAKALCRIVADFTRERGFPAVILHTTVVQTDAQKLYEHMGYTKTREFVVPELAAKILNFKMFEYRLDLQQNKERD
ncbi:hypothetical protein GOODEAATRI_026425 [Goodea atripinnis]|uniref:N-acetyltransferase domain-containing protein n=1 Tax=Goodea atripinnis TaxID=208336 RepID=A0ABV0NRS6_9TELE